MYQRALSIALLLAFAAPVLGQASATQPPKPDPSGLRKEAVAFLRETMGDVQNMRTLENRISFSAELAGLMWYHDEGEARTMFNGAIGDFRELISRLDARMMAIPEEAEMDGVGIFTEGSDRRKFEMKYRVAMAVRQQIATSIAEHDPDVALSFFYDTASANPKVASWGGRDSMFEMNLLKEIAVKSPSKAAQYGVKSLEKGFDSQHVDLLRKIYEKDQEVAVEFGAALLKKAKDTKFKTDELYNLGSLMEFGSTNLDASRKPDAKKPVYSQADMRELAEVMSRSILESENLESASHYLPAIDKYAPARAAQIRAKIGGVAGNPRVANTFTVRGNMRVNVPPPEYSGPVDTAGYGNASGNSNTNSAWQQEQDVKRNTEEKLMTDVQKIGKDELPKEEREGRGSVAEDPDAGPREGQADNGPEHACVAGGEGGR